MAVNMWCETHGVRHARVWVDAGCIRTPLWCVCGWRCWINTFPKLLCCFHEQETLPHLMFGGTDDRITSCRERRRSAPWGNNTTREILSIKFGHFKTQPFWGLSFIERYWLWQISGPSERLENLSGDKFRRGFTTSVVLNFSTRGSMAHFCRLMDGVISHSNKDCTAEFFAITALKHALSHSH